MKLPPGFFQEFRTCGQFVMLQMFLNLDPESLIRYGGLLLVCLLTFCSTGLFFSFFLPIGAILFTAGVFAATGHLPEHILTIHSLLILSSIAGSLSGFGFGRSTGRYFYNRKDSRFFKRRYLVSTEDFYKKYGALALMTGYFLPMIRSFSPVVAGIIGVKFTRFLLFSILGSVIFILVFVLSGYLIGNLPILRQWLKYIVGGFILIVTVPLAVKIVREMKKPHKNSNPNDQSSLH